jgi:hypothetical protein
MMTRRGIAAVRVGDGARPFGLRDERLLPIQLTTCDTRGLQNPLAREVPMRSMLSTITVCGVLLFLSPSYAATSDTPNAKSDQSADRIGGQAGKEIPLEQRRKGADSSGGERVGGQAGQEPPMEERTIGDGSSGGERVGGQAGLEGDPKKRDSEAK